jgi:hypothetical protein
VPYMKVDNRIPCIKRQQHPYWCKDAVGEGIMNLSVRK